MIGMVVARTKRKSMIVEDVIRRSNAQMAVTKRACH
jgi:hypothetical protein